MLFKKLHNATRIKNEGTKQVRVPTQVLQPKEYARFPQITLPQPKLPDVTLKKLWEMRRSTRDFSNTPLTMEQLSTIAHAATGAVKDESNEIKRNAPSGGALYPLEYYFVVQSVASTEQGVYHYHFPSHSLEQMSDDISVFIDSLTHDWSKDAPAFLIITSVWDRQEFKYGEQSYQLALLEAGHVMQNVLLTATSLDIKSCPLLGFDGEQVDKNVLSLENRNENSLYVAAFGR